MVTDEVLIPPGVKGGWLSTHSGRQFYPLAPKLEDILIEDIAHALAAQARWAGHTRHPFSVAQHCVLASRLVPASDALWALLHDASEAYLVDVPRLIKRLPAMAAYRAVEQLLQRTIYQRFGLTGPEPESVKQADLLLMVAEAQDLLPRLHPDWPEAIRTGRAPRPAWTITDCWSHGKARSEFLKRFEELTASRSAATPGPTPTPTPATRPEPTAPVLAHG